MPQVRSTCPVVAVLTLLIAVWSASAVTAQDGFVAEPRLEVLVQQAWRWREIRRTEAPSYIHSMFARRDGLVIVADADGLWAYDGMEWTQQPGWDLLAGDTVEILDATERGVVIALMDQLVGIPADWEPTPGAGREAFAELALNRDLPPRMVHGAGRLPDGTPIMVMNDQIVWITPDSVRPLVAAPKHAGHITCVGADGAGRIWCITDQGLWRLHDGTWDRYDFPEPVERRNVYDRATAVGGPLYFLPSFFDHRYQALVWNGGEIETLPHLEGGGRIASVASTRNRELVVALEGPGLRILRDGEWHAAPIPEPFSETVVKLDFHGGDRLLAMTQSGRLLVCDLASTRWQIHDPIGEGVSGIINAMATSARGGLWLGTHSGIIRWNGEAFVDKWIDAPGLGIDLNEVTAIAEDAAGHVWIGSGSHFSGALQFDGERWHAHREPEGLGDHFVHVIRSGPDGSLWFGMLANERTEWNRGSIARRSADGQWTRFAGSDDLGVRAYDFAWSDAGELYVGLRTGAARFDGERFSLLDNPMVAAHDSIFAVHVDSQDRLWLGLGLRESGLIRGQGHTWERFAGGEWAGVGAAALAETADGSLWMASGLGLARWHDGIVSTVNARGAMSSPTFWPVLPTEDGRGLWLGSRGSGLVRFTPDDLTPPRVTGAQTVRPSELPERVRLVTWQGADAWNDTRPEHLRFSFRLDDEDWSPWAQGQLDSSHRLARLSPGEHELEVRALDRAGNVSTEPYVTRFEVPQPFWARPPMLIALTALVLTIAQLAWAASRRRRDRRLAEREMARLNDQLRQLAGELLSSQEEERRHLAQDLHDDLGQLLTATCMHVQHAAKVDDPAKRAECLDRANHSVRQALDCVRNVVSRLRPPLLDDLGLEVAVSSTLDDYKKATGIDVRASVQLDGVEFPDHTASHVFRILNECLTNIARHSGAQHVRVVMKIRGDRLRLRVTDDGQGFDPDAAALKGGMGLMGMSERAESLRGRLRIDSAPGRGTTIRASIPLAEGSGVTQDDGRADDSWTRTESSSWTTT